jgi:hypothetical protein
MILFSFSMHLEYIVLHRFGASSETSRYFSLAAVTLPSFNILAGYLGFILAPRIKRTTTLSLTNARNTLFLVTAGVSLLVALVYGGVSVLFTQFFPHRSLDLQVLLLLAAAGGLRVLYVLPSSVIGSRGSNKQIDLFVALNTGALLVFALFLATAYNQTGSILARHAAVAALANWVLRVLSGVFVSWKIILSISIEKPEIGD